jgi:hypothetical protein
MYWMSTGVLESRRARCENFTQAILALLNEANPMRDEFVKLLGVADDFIKDDDMRNAIKAGKAALKLAGKDNAEEYFAQLLLGRTYCEDDDFANGIKYIKRAQEIAQKLYGSTSVPYAIALSKEALVHLNCDDLAKAEQISDVATEIVLTAEQPLSLPMQDNVGVSAVEVLSIAAVCKAMVSNTVGTIELLRHACGCAKNIFGDTHPKTIQCTVELQVVLDSRGFKKEAKLLKKFVQNSRRQSGITADFMIAYHEGNENGLFMAGALQDSMRILRKKAVNAAKKKQAKSPPPQSVTSISIVPEHARTKKAKNSFVGYQIKITLKHTDPAIWRRVVVPANISLLDLHDVIQTAMGWSDDHLHQFIIRKEIYGDSSHSEVIEEQDFELIDFEFKVGSKFEYEYDFGDNWQHSIEIEKKLSAEEYEASAVFLEGKGACPPEDCGGIPGFYMLLDAIDGCEDAREDCPDWEDGFDRDRLPKCFKKLAKTRK